MRKTNHFCSAIMSSCSLPYTPLTVREQFRLRRFRFTHHDLRAFVTSWVSFPVFAAYRFFLPIYLAGWMIAHITLRRDSDGAHWLIYITNWSSVLFLASQAFAAVVTALYIARPSILTKEGRNGVIMSERGGSEDYADESRFREDRISWIVKIFWFLYVTSHTAMIMICIGYWTIEYTPCDNSNTNITSFTESNSTNYNYEKCGADLLSIHVHGINGLLAIADVLISLVPFHIFHILYPSIFTTTYVIFSIVYFAAGGRTERGNRYIYSLLDYGETTLFSCIAAILLIIAPMFIYAIPLLTACARDKLYTVISRSCHKKQKNCAQVNVRENHSKSKWKLNFSNPGSRRPLSQSSSDTI